MTSEHNTSHHSESFQQPTSGSAGSHDNKKQDLVNDQVAKLREMSQEDQSWLELTLNPLFLLLDESQLQNPQREMAEKWLDEQLERKYTIHTEIAAFWERCADEFRVGNMIIRNFYAVLDIPSSASLQEIKTGFHTQRRKFHPDFHRKALELDDRLVSEITLVLQLINSANKTLRDPATRAQYDSDLNQAKKVEQKPTQENSSSVEQTFPPEIQIIIDKLLNADNLSVIKQCLKELEIHKLPFDGTRDGQAIYVKPRMILDAIAQAENILGNSQSEDVLVEIENIIKAIGVKWIERRVEKSLQDVYVSISQIQEIDNSIHFLMLSLKKLEKHDFAFYQEQNGKVIESSASAIIARIQDIQKSTAKAVNILICNFPEIYSLKYQVYSEIRHSWGRVEKTLNPIPPEIKEEYLAFEAKRKAWNR